MAIAYLAFGSNLGNRLQYIEKAIALLKKSGVVISKVSTVIETVPVGGPPQGKYLNAVIECLTDQSPEELHHITKTVEYKLGRVREIINGPRVIDIDILLYGNVKLVSKRLLIPHPRMFERDFVLKPLREIAPEVLD